MIFHVLTLFPEMIESACDNSILKRAIAKDLIKVSTVNIRDFSQEKHGKVDDYTYGGGAGMLMQAQPVYDAWNSIRPAQEKTEPADKPAKLRTVYVTPQGKPLTQKMVKELSSEQELVILCGHYEGIDERVLDEIVTDRISIGDYVLTGGELPALVLIDAVSRLVPGVLGSEESAGDESFERDLLEYPQYSRPETWHGKAVPEVLLSGDHKKIIEWRRQEAEKRTRETRPDLYERYSFCQKTIKTLLKQKKNNAFLIDGLLRGDAELLYARDAIAVGVHRSTGVVMLCCDTLDEGKELLSHVADDVHLLIHNCEDLIPHLQEKYGFNDPDSCYQSVYTQHTALPVAHKDIRTYPIDKLDYAVENYGGERQREYLRERIQKGEFFAAYEEDRIVGFCGVHAGGSLGLLYVDPQYRRSSVGSSLASYLVNLSLERGGIPYAHIRVANEPSLKMQEKMGLYVGNKKVYWMFRK